MEQHYPYHAYTRHKMSVSFTIFRNL